MCKIVGMFCKWLPGPSSNGICERIFNFPHKSRAHLLCTKDTIYSFWPRDAIWQHRSWSSFDNKKCGKSWWHQVIMWTKVDLSSVVLCNIHMRVIFHSYSITNGNIMKLMSIMKKYTCIKWSTTNKPWSAAKSLLFSPDISTKLCHLLQKDPKN